MKISLSNPIQKQSNLVILSGSTSYKAKQIVLLVSRTNQSIYYISVSLTGFPTFRWAYPYLSKIPQQSYYITSHIKHVYQNTILLSRKQKEASRKYFKTYHKYLSTISKKMP